ncbi:DUF5594 family protein [Caballeronia sp. GAWG1-1]|uniref:DUF5594 family protein n=1 Tax=Caballeronia sp. GAWG1-1 TaxID=2921742 RepID=UPI002027BB0C|nr:DUF5594 family protein [Caballeronia sp. GAWG1-1]
MNREQALRFESEFMPRIAERVAALLHGVRVDIVPGEYPHQPAKLHLSAQTPPHADDERARGYPLPLNIFLTWDDEEIERLMHPHGEARFMRYLDALDIKFAAWQGARDVDMVTRSQAETSVLLGGLDFEA